MTKGNNRKLGLSKSQYLRAMQCHKSLYLYKYHPELREEASASKQAVFDTGTAVGILAQSLFPGGVEVPYDGVSISDQIEMTKQAIDSGKKVIYEASFNHDGIFVKADILRKVSRGWELYEVKSAASLKDINRDDIALQYHILTEAGLQICKAYLVVINSGYVRDGEIDPQQLFTKLDLTKDVRAMQKMVVANLASIRIMLNKTKVPAIDIGPYCSNPYECDFWDHCWSHIPKDSVFDLAGKGIDKFGLYGEGIVNLKDIPLDRLNTNQRYQVEMFLNKGIEFKARELKKFLDELWYPLCFLDFETFMSAIPPFDGTRPYNQIPFQYSLHTLKRKGGKLHHSHFLGAPNQDPRKELLEQLLNDIPENACVLTFNKTFEIGVLKALAVQYPRKRKRIMGLIDNIHDLMVPFRQRDAYHWQMQGSYSIKKVLPAFVPEMSYDSLEISDGSMAMEAWHLMCAAQPGSELETLRRNLLDYCEQDTLAMVRLLEVLQQKAKTPLKKR
ncbi:hypothetical protein JCM30471_08240 [Desulfuromonas carbonis]